MRRVVLPFLLATVSCGGCPQGHALDGPVCSLPDLPPCEPGPGTYCGTESHAILDNPHQGFTAFHTLASDLPLSQHPKTRVAYVRYWWDELEPEPGAVRFDLLERDLAAADAQGMTLGFRVMPEESREGARRVPGWLAESAGGTWGRHGGSGARYFSPTYDSPAYLEAVERTVAALGARLDGDPRLEHVDVGFVGDSGEWAYAVDGATLPNEASTRRILEAFSRAFPHTPVLMNVGATEDTGGPLRQAVQLGMGWRADCWGDLRGAWNHQDDFYERRLAEAGAQEAWKKAPVAVETCGDMEQWSWMGYQPAQVKWLLRWALDRHVSFINNKSRPVPAAFRPAVDEYLACAGPRVFVRRAVRGAKRVEFELHNRGSTPLYGDWRLSLDCHWRSGNNTYSVWGLSDPLGPLLEPLTITEVDCPGSWRVCLRTEDHVAARLANDGVDENGCLELTGL